MKHVVIESVLSSNPSKLNEDVAYITHDDIITSILR